MIIMKEIISHLNLRGILMFLMNRGLLPFIPDKPYVSLLHYAQTGRFPNLKNPKTLSEKLQWLKLYNRNPELHLYVDKYRVKEFYKEAVGEQYIIPTLGVWDKAEDIDFSTLPNQFVIKANHNSAKGTYICRDKSKMDEKKVRKNLQKAINSDFWKRYREWAYKDIPRKIIAEQFLQNADGSPIVDYKFYCYGGKPRYFMYSVGEAVHRVRNHKFDMDCNSIDHRFKAKPTITLDEIKLPDNFSEMKSIVEKLCVGFPHIRIDMYNVDGKIYMGEMTFYSGKGFINIDDADLSQELADYIDISRL